MEFKDDLIKQVGSIERLYAQIIMNTRDELQAFIQACGVLNCENVCPVTLSTKPERKFINGRKVQPPEKTSALHILIKYCNCLKLRCKVIILGQENPVGRKGCTYAEDIFAEKITNQYGSDQQ
ncbi:hypothetical protein I8L96_004529 [Escherichia coli]|nr:hypothetical protein [Escherichia coli]EHK4754725.1 hypothetical protein [Escherichia coli]EIH0402135.1 hypothetical protein [Escherichia coli]